MRIIQQRHFPLHNPQIGAADHPDFAVRPRLARDPVQRIVSIAAFLRERLKHAFRSVASAHILHHHGVAVLGENPIGGREVRALAVGRANQNGGNAIFHVGPEYVSRQANAVAHLGAHVELLQDGRRERRRRQRRYATDDQAR